MKPFDFVLRQLTQDSIVFISSRTLVGRYRAFAAAIIIIHRNRNLSKFDALRIFSAVPFPFFCVSRFPHEKKIDKFHSSTRPFVPSQRPMHHRQAEEGLSLVIGDSSRGF